MTVQRIQFSQTYVQDEHQRELIALANAIDQLQTTLASMQADIATLKKKAGVK